MVTSNARLALATVVIIINAFMKFVYARTIRHGGKTATGIYFCLLQIRLKSRFHAACDVRGSVPTLDL